jgi:ketosteroid isomerase-like protein
MSDENVALAQRVFNTFPETDFEGFFGMASPDIRVYPRPEEPGVKPCYEGWDEMMEYIINWFSGWDEYTFEAANFIDAGEYVIVDVREVGVMGKSGMRVEENFAHALKLEDGKLVEWRMYGPVSEAMEALGIEPR